MTAIAFDIPVEIERITAGLERFLRAEVVARHEKHVELLEDPRRLEADPLVQTRHMKTLRRPRGRETRRRPHRAGQEVHRAS